MEAINPGCDKCDFRNEVCHVINNDEFNELKRSSEPMVFEKGDVVIRQGSSLQHLAYISQGLIKFEHVSANKQIQIPGMIKGPALICGSYLFSGEVNSLSVVALNECHICLIDIHVIRSRAKVNALFGIKIFEMISVFHQQLLENQLSLSSKRVPGRIAGVLLMFQNKIFLSSVFTLPLTRREISHLATCSEENVIRTLTGFERDEIITLQGKGIEITNPKKLKQIYDLG